MEHKHLISTDGISLDTIFDIVQHNIKLELSVDVKIKIKNCREYLSHKLWNTDAMYYGINTGFGDLCNVKISPDQVEELQKNLVMSHACGMGEEVPQDIVKVMLLLKIQGLSYGYSGITLETVERLTYFFNNNMLPVVYQQGSLGASGDLAPLAHLSLPLLGLGEFNYKGTKRKASEVLQEHNLEPLNLRSKEGLALLNGTQFMSAFGCYLIAQAGHLLNSTELIAAVSIDAFDCKLEPFTAQIHQIRNQPGQQQTAENIRQILSGSEIIQQPKQQVQDAYSFRCIPQVIGACRDVVAHVKQVFEREINGVTDNPNVFPDDDMIVSGGNFHGQPLAMALDYLAIALAEIGSISERRTYKMLSGTRNLPPFLSGASGLHSGLMIPQYTAAAIVSENKQLCTPASVDTITSSNGQEDHVSMGANAATKCYRVLNNLEKILSIELLTASQALEFRRPLKSSPSVEQFIEAYRKRVVFEDKDRVWHYDMVNGIDFIKHYTY